MINMLQPLQNAQQHENRHGHHPCITLGHSSTAMRTKHTDCDKNATLIEKCPTAVGENPPYYHAPHPNADTEPEPGTRPLTHDLAPPPLVVAHMQPQLHNTQSATLAGPPTQPCITSSINRHSLQCLLNFRTTSQPHTLDLTHHKHCMHTQYHITAQA
jgi:hypothetical protein